jgi:hypothetical protein
VCFNLHQPREKLSTGVAHARTAHHSG